MSSSGTIPCDDTLVAMAPSHLVTDTQLAFARDINLDLLDDSRIDIVSALDPVHRAIAFKLQLRELVLVHSQ